jgi:hypothetical protein
VRAAVCCPGPSLPRRWPGRAGYDLVWAVNRALIPVPDADWLSAGDPVLFTGLLPVGCRPRVGAVTMDPTIDAVRDLPAWAGLAWVPWSALALVAAHKPRGRPIAWSVQVALCHAAELGATQVDLYGADGAAAGTPLDCTGYAGEDRSIERWRREALDLVLTIELLAAVGVTTTTIAP